MPAISVLTTTYQGAPFVAQTVRSIQGQSFANWELIIVDDGSTDNTLDILFRLAATDTRIRVEPRAHCGMAASNNYGLSLCRAPIVARLDQDDIALPDRLGRQAAAFARDPGLSLLGGWLRTFGEADYLWTYPESHDEISCELLFRCPIADPTVAIRRNHFERAVLSYDETIEAAEDYDLWDRASRHVRMANLPRVLSLYRLHSGQFSESHRPACVAETQRVCKRNLADLMIVPEADELDIHFSLFAPERSSGGPSLNAVEQWLLRLRSANEAVRRYPVTAFDRLVTAIWWKKCTDRSELTGGRFERFRESRLGGDAPGPISRIAGGAHQRILLWRERLRTNGCVPNRHRYSRSLNCRA